MQKIGMQAVTRLQQQQRQGRLARVPVAVVRGVLAWSCTSVRSRSGLLSSAATCFSSPSAQMLLGIDCPGERQYLPDTLTAFCLPLPSCEAQGPHSDAMSSAVTYSWLWRSVVQQNQILSPAQGSLCLEPEARDLLVSSCQACPCVVACVQAHGTVCALVQCCPQERPPGHPSPGGADS